MERATVITVDDEAGSVGFRPHVAYDDDLHAWALEQAELIRAGRFGDLDLLHLADEVADVARREVHELEGRLALVFQHLLKWDHQRRRRGASWARSIREHRRQVLRLLDESPSLRTRLDGLVEEAYRQGRVAALNETKLPDSSVPEANPYSFQEAMTRPIVWPEP